MTLIAALPMYDWPELRADVDAQWAAMRDALRARGIDAPEHLTRRNAGMPAVPGGIRDVDGRVIAPDPATLAPDALDLPTLWRHPALLFAQTCRGPMELGLAEHVVVVGEPDYDGVEGGAGPLYSSAIVMRRADVLENAQCPAPADGTARLPLDLISGRVFAFNSADSMSGLIGLTRDLARLGTGPSIFPRHIETGAHRASLRALADGHADVCAIDCRSWQLSQRFDAFSASLIAVGWTSSSKGLPFIAARGLAGRLWDETLAEFG